MSLMKAVRISGPGTFEYIDAEIPRPGAKQVLVKTMMLSICGSDIHMLHYEPFSEYPRRIGTTGHEMVGTVVEMGDEVARAGGLREGMVALVLAPYHDAMAEYFVAESEWVLPLPAGRSHVEYLMAQQLGTVIYASKRLPPVIGKSAVIIGQGSAGLFFAAMLKRLGVERIVAFDLVADRLQYSTRFGADYAIDNSASDPVAATREYLGDGLADIVVEAAGEIDSINLAPKLLATYGILMLFGVPRARSFGFDYWDFYRTYATTITSAGAMLEPGKHSFRMALELIRSGAIDMHGVATHTLPFSRLAEAYRLAKAKEDGALKVVVSMPGAQSSHITG